MFHHPTYTGYFLPSGEYFLESHIFSIGPAEIFEFCRHVDTEVAPVPRLDLVFIDIFSLLVALTPPISLCILLEPFDILPVIFISEVFILRGCIEYIHRETELMLTVSRRGTEGVRTLSEIPHPLLIGGTSVGTDDREGNAESLLEVSCHDPEGVSGFLSESEPTASCGIDMGPADREEVARLISPYIQWAISAHESKNTGIFSIRKGIIFLAYRYWGEESSRFERVYS